ncbi:hypothetical protein MSG28_009260 [Choristoneura fumiferana]|uniref:Uncharacterized protein n=1 Tax=Choristoneura fumiferana TaxID=7141 RepID=A0ACC0KXS2_CHOFU|nr:hypothetical protein MSG28_009260 [Choristoneura fumiferana]
MSKLIPSAAKLLTGNTITKAAAPVATTTKVKYSTKNEATFEIKPYKLHKLDSGPASTATLTSEDALKIYEKLAVLRRLETAAGNLYKEKIIRGFCHLYSGPLVMEMETYRYSGHSMSDPGTSYRTRDEIQEEIDAKVRTEVDEATKQAKSEPEIGIEELSGDIYYNNAEKIIRGMHPEASLQHLEVQPRTRKMLSKFSRSLNLKLNHLIKYVLSPEVHNFDKSKIPTEVKVTRQEALELYENMVLIRRMETEAANLYKAKKIYGFCHLYVGTEAVGTGIVAAMKPTDNLITSYRCHGIIQQQGKDGPRLVLSELTGKADGLMGGKGGSMHLYVPPHFYGGQGIVGGQVHESFNIASLLKIPVVFVCENNYYGMGTASERSSSSTNYFQAGREIAKVASDYSRSGQGPMIVEMQTYRYYGHSMSDPGVSYRTREEVQAVRKTKDPLNKLKKIIVENKLATDEEIEEINKKAKAACAEAKKAAEAGSEPDAKELYTHLYVKYLEQPRKRTCVG